MVALWLVDAALITMVQVATQEPSEEMGPVSLLNEKRST